MNLQEIEKRLAEIRKELEKRGAELTAEEIKKFEEEVDSLTEKKKALVEGAEKRKGILEKIAAGAGATKRGFDSPTPSPTAGVEEKRNEDDPTNSIAYRRAFMGYVLGGTPIPAELRTDAVTKTTDGSAVIPTTILDKIVEKLENVGMILPLVTNTAYKGGVSIPTSSVKPIASWVSEGAGSEKQKKTVAQSGAITFAYHKLRCAVAVTLEMDTMALSAFESMLIRNVTDAMIKAIEQAIISGSGTGQPKGIITETPVTGQALEIVAPAYSDLVNAEAALPQKYEAGARWCMSKKTFMAYFGLLDSNGQPIGRVNYGIAGTPERYLLGRPVVCCDYIDSYASTLTAGKVFAFLFNFEDYTLNTNYAMSMKRYEDNDTDDQITKAVMLVDGKVVDKNSLVTLKKKAAAST